jgi:hypothetical protein
LEGYGARSLAGPSGATSAKRRINQALKGVDKKNRGACGAAKHGFFGYQTSPSHSLPWLGSKNWDLQPIAIAFFRSLAAKLNLGCSTHWRSSITAHDE